MAYKLKSAYQSTELQEGFVDYLAALTGAYQRLLAGRPAAPPRPTSSRPALP
jgi:hypothetical protein